MSRLRMGSLSNPFAKTQEPQEGYLSANRNARPTTDRSQSALLPVRSHNSDPSAEDESVQTSAPSRVPKSNNTARRNRSHTVAVAFESSRRGSGPSTRGRRRGSSISNQRNMEEGRARGSEHSDRPGSPVQYEIGDEREELNDEVVGMLDVIDPEVSTVNHLQNVTNSIVIPHFPALWSRRPEVRIPESPSEAPTQTGRDKEDETLAAEERGDQVPPLHDHRRASSPRHNRSRRSSTVSQMYPPSHFDHMGSTKATRIPSDGDDAASIKTDGELDAHVKKVLDSSKRAKAKRALRGFWAFVKTPMGAFTAIYGFLCAFWGAAIVLFLLGWIPTSSKDTQDKWVEISSQVCNGLFTITGVGLIPWRVVDTYRMSIIWTLKRRTERLRNKRGLPPHEDPNDIPDPVQAKDYVSVLTDRDQERLRFQQEKFAASQTWYKPHATATHKAFPMAWALWNTILMDGNSFFQCILCGCMWGLNRHERPAWTTGSLIPLSFLCGIGAGILIWQGSVRTKKTISVESKLRDALQLPLAIAVPRTQDGTVITGQNKAPLPVARDAPAKTKDVGTTDEGPDIDADSSDKDNDSKGGDHAFLDPLGAERADVARRSTVAFGPPGEKEVEIRQGGASLATPGYTPSTMGGSIELGAPITEVGELEERNRS